MSLHLIKLCVGCDTVSELEGWIEENRTHHRRLGRDYEQTHTTRMVPKRIDALLSGGLNFSMGGGKLIGKGYSPCFMLDTLFSLDNTCSAFSFHSLDMMASSRKLRIKGKDLRFLLRELVSELADPQSQRTQSHDRRANEHEE
jgi:hypothetical protein